MVINNFFGRLRQLHFVARMVSLAAGIAVLIVASAASAQQAFKTPQEAASALVEAVRTGEQRAILAVLGRRGGDIVSSGDAVADDTARQIFLEAYEAQHQITMEGESTAFMVIGRAEFPFPIPIVRKAAAWRFDTAAGRLEILYRRIGRNELNAIQACLAYVDAQYEYAEQDRTGAGVGVFAQRVVSSPGKKDGLYWPAIQDGDESPLGELVAMATSQGYRVGGTRAPFHGYYYKILTKQGANVPGGALDYMVRGKMIGGFALVAYPAEYGNSGVMTFLVSHAGVVYEKDLGPRTSAIAERMTVFNPDQTWKNVPVNEPVQ